jgi:hypothetical protein
MSSTLCASCSSTPRANYQQDEVVVYDDGFDAGNATKFEQLQIPGCADAEMAWKLGRYHLAVARLRPNTYTWTTDVASAIAATSSTSRPM